MHIMDMHEACYFDLWQIDCSFYIGVEPSEVFTNNIILKIQITCFERRKR